MIYRIFAQALLALARSRFLKKLIKNSRIYDEIRNRLSKSAGWITANVSKLAGSIAVINVLSFLFSFLAFYLGWPTLYNFIQWIYYKFKSLLFGEGISGEDYARLSDQERQSLESINSFLEAEMVQARDNAIAEGYSEEDLVTIEEVIENARNNVNPIDMEPEEDETDPIVEEEAYPEENPTPSTRPSIDPFIQDKQPNTTYSGTDMVATINIPGKGPIVFGELAQLSYSVFREKVPVRSMGRVSMKGYTRGMRTITGILAFTVFNESIVYRCMRELREQGYRMLMDEMPVFDITVVMANEYGSRSKMTLYGVSTYTEGKMMGVDDVLTQNVYEFYALDIDPLQKLEDLRGSSKHTPTNDFRGRAYDPSADGIHDPYAVDQYQQYMDEEFKKG